MVNRNTRMTEEGRPNRQQWLETLPDVVADLARRWRLTVGAPFVDDGTCSWVAPVICAGRRAVLKLGMPHMEGAHEIAGLRL